MVDENLMRRYLLGQVSPGEADFCDEASITNDDFAEELEAVENELVDDYVRHELSADDLKQFEAVYLLSPLRRKKVDFARSLQAYGAKTFAAEQSIASTSVELSPAVVKLIKKNWFDFPAFNLSWGLAAAATCLFFFSGWFFWQGLQERRQANQAQTEFAALQKHERELQTQIHQQQSANEESAQELARVRTQLAALEQQKNLHQQVAKNEPSPELLTKPKTVNFSLAPQTRGIGQVAALTVPADATAASFNLRLESDDFTAYKISLRDNAANKIIWQSGKHKANGESLLFTVPANLLRGQSYAFAVTGIAADRAAEPLNSYLFRVIRP